MTVALSASLLLSATPAEVATKPVTYSGFTIQVPAKWRVKKLGPEVVHVYTGACAKKAAECEGFTLGGPMSIAHGNEDSAYTPSRPYQSSTGVVECPVDKKLFADGRGKLVSAGKAPFGKGRRAGFAEWKLTCDGGSVTYPQRVWFLKTKKVIVVDQWKTPGLGAILAKAVWK